MPGLPGLTTVNFIGDADTTSANAIRARLIAFYQDLQFVTHEDVTYTSTGVATIIDDATGEVTASVPCGAGSAPMAGVTDRLPAGTQGLLHVRTGQYVMGREVRGRLYAAAPMESENGTNGSPLSTYLSTLVAAANDNLIGSLDFPLAVWSPSHNLALQATAVTASPHWARLSTRRT